MESYKKLLLANQAWVREKTQQNPAYFKDLAKDQNPDFLWIGCSDSRVPAEEITGARPGELFVHRNVANMVISTDVNLMSVLHFAVDKLKVKNIVVCGHTGCGGVRGALSRQHLGLLDRWLEPIKNTYEKHSEELGNAPSAEKSLNRLVELNLREQVENLAKTYVVQRAWEKEQRPHLHGWVYEMETGTLRDLVCVEPGSSIPPIFKFDSTSP